MGIKQLNRLMRQYSKQEQWNINKLSGKTISIDIMIYIYKFLANNSLLEDIYMMCVLLKCNNINGIFVFDGEKPKEKQEELQQRREKRKEAWLKYDEIINDIGEGKLLEKDMKIELMKLKRQCVKIKSNHIQDVQNLLKYFGMTYVIAEGEADKLCAELVINNKADACLSDDMDLFMYGCPIVLRLFSITKKTLYVYRLNDILRDLNITFDNFKIICALSGTDYNVESQTNSIFSLYKKYLYYKNNECNEEFLDWLIKENPYYDRKRLTNTINMFEITKNFNYQPVNNSFVDKINLYSLLEKEYFLNPISVY
tara:strand:+ start:2207 stop:3142 length:936 start_codon:yes stop_codon:yes gene_type:complete